MNYRRLGKTGLMVSEIGFGAEWMERRSAEDCAEIIRECEKYGINIFDCWMSEPNVRSSLGAAIKGRREKWYIQGHIGSVWENGQYVRTRDVEKCKVAFEDLLERLGTDYVDLGMIHYIDREDDWNTAMNGPFIEYVKELKAAGRIHHIGMSTHNHLMAKKAVSLGEKGNRFEEAHGRPWQDPRVSHQPLTLKFTRSPLNLSPAWTLFLPPLLSALFPQ